MNRPPRTMAWLAALSLALLAACSSVAVTPSSLRTARVPQAEREGLARTWGDAVSRCNAFLASPYRHALPPGRIELDDAQGMRFVGDAHTWPIEVRCTSWGDFVQFCGFQAQERTYGFTVGECDPERDRVADNGLFRDQNGFAMSPDLVADLILHETTHVVSGEGAIGFWKSAGYYCEAFFLFRYGPTHSDERLAYGTNEEYHAFIQSVDRDAAIGAALLAELEAHVAKCTNERCRHGPKAVKS